MTFDGMENQFGVAKECIENKEDMRCYDWFFCTKKLSGETLLNTVLKN
jgi:peroxiredoxin 2/4